jgi:hypothetical protein
VQQVRTWAHDKGEGRRLDFFLPSLLDFDSIYLLLRRSIDPTDFPFAHTKRHFSLTLISAQTARLTVLTQEPFDIKSSKLQKRCERVGTS